MEYGEDGDVALRLIDQWSRTMKSWECLDFRNLRIRELPPLPDSCRSVFLSNLPNLEVAVFPHQLTSIYILSCPNLRLKPFRESADLRVALVRTAGLSHHIDNTFQRRDFSVCASPHVTAIMNEQIRRHNARRVVRESAEEVGSKSCAPIRIAWKTRVLSLSLEDAMIEDRTSVYGEGEKVVKEPYTPGPYSSDYGKKPHELELCPVAPWSPRHAWEQEAVVGFDVGGPLLRLRCDYCKKTVVGYSEIKSNGAQKTEWRLMMEC